MDGTAELPRKQWACVKMNGDFLCIDTYSGYRSCALDSEGHQHLLAVDASEAVVGEALIDSLAHSRFLRAEEVDSFFSYEEGLRVYAEWTRNLMERFRYKTKRALFKGMKNCYVEKRERKIVIQPTRHEKLEGWSRAKGDEQLDVVVAEGSSAEEVGAALRLALGRCVG